MANDEIANENTVETELTSVDDDGGLAAADTRLAQTSAKGSQLRDDITQLEAVHDIAASSLGDGGLDETAARVIDVAVESFCKRWDVPASIGVESFGVGLNVNSTRVACESIKEVLAKAGEAIVKFIRDCIERIKTAAEAVLDVGNQISRKIPDLKARAAKCKFEAIDSSDKPQSWIKHFAINGEVDFAKTFSTIGAMRAGFISSTENVLNDLKLTAHSESKNAIHKVSKLFGVKTTINDKLKHLFEQEGSNQQVFAVPGNGFITCVNVDGLDHVAFTTIEVPIPKKHFKLLSKGMVTDALVLLDDLVKHLADYKAEGAKDATVLENIAKGGADFTRKGVGFAPNENDPAKKRARTHQNVMNYMALNRAYIYATRQACLGTIAAVEATLRLNHV